MTMGTPTGITMTMGTTITTMGPAVATTMLRPRLQMADLASSWL
jgi:adenylosuccinate synthase